MEHHYGGLRARQIASIKQMINLNEPMTSSLSAELVWKVLILDKYTQEVISPILTVKQLRELGVTLHFLLGSKREVLPDVPAIYFVTPTEKNIQFLCEDLKRGLYDQFYLNMVYPISRPMLEELALAAIDGSTVQQVSKVTDQYLSFISLEEDLFMLKKYSIDNETSFFAINDPSIDNSKIEKIINTIVAHLFAVCVTLGVVPIIKCPRGNAAEQIAKKLDQKIRENLKDSRNNLFTSEAIRARQLNLNRPILILADRIIDISTILHHTWTYQAMAADILEMELNRIRMSDKNGRQKEYEFSTEDKLWQNHKASPFPIVAEAIQEDLDNYRRNEDEIKRLRSAMGSNDGIDDVANTIAEFSFGDATAKLSTAVGSLPELIEKKRLIDQHTNIATALLDNIKERRLDVLYENEEKILNGQDISIMELLRNLSNGPNNEDLLRLILIYTSSHSISSAEKKEILELMEERSIPVGAFQFLLRLKSLSSFGQTPAKFHQGAGTKTINMFSKLLNQSSRFVMEGVKNLVPRKHNLPLTKLVENLTEPKIGVTAGIMSSSSESSSSEFVAFDPKLTHYVEKDWTPTQSPTDIIVFAIGGGNYIEYQNLIEYGKTKGLQRIIYGCTEMVTPKQFIEQVDYLAPRKSALCLVIPVPNFYGTDYFSLELSFALVKSTWRWIGIINECKYYLAHKHF